MRIKDFFKTKEERDRDNIEETLDKLVNIIQKIIKTNNRYHRLTGEQFKEKLKDEILKDKSLNSFFSRIDRETTFKVIESAMYLCQRSQVNEALMAKSYICFTKKELTNLDFSKQEIDTIEKNNKLEFERLSKFSKKELLEMGIPEEDIIKIKRNK